MVVESPEYMFHNVGTHGSCNAVQIRLSYGYCEVSVAIEFATGFSLSPYSLE